MRILIANYEFPPIGGGASKASFELARTLVRRGEEVCVLTSRHAGAPAVEVLEGMTVHRVWSWRKGVHDCGVRGAATFLVAALPRLRRILRSRDIDVVHCFFGLPTGLLSFYSHGVAKVPYIVSLRGSDVPLYDRDSLKLRVLHRLTRSVSASIWRRASEIIAVSRGLQRLAEASFPGVRVGVIYNGIDRSEENGPGAGADAREGLVRITCVSRLIPRKGVAELIDAVASLRDLHIELVIIGAGPSEPVLRGLAHRHGISARVRFMGYCSPEIVQYENSRADLFVLPTRSEAFANVILEAMEAGLPVVATRVGGVGEAVVEGKTGVLVEPRRPRQLADAIRTLAQDPALRARYGRAGQGRARELFTWESAAGLYVQAYGRAVAADP